jgi:hypothetical protein
LCEKVERDLALRSGTLREPIFLPKISFAQTFHSTVMTNTLTSVHVLSRAMSLSARTGTPRPGLGR